MARRGAVASAADSRYPRLCHGRFAPLLEGRNKTCASGRPHCLFMDYVWSPWRFRYVSEAPGSRECFLCTAVAAGPERDREHRVLHRGRKNLVLLNIFPYTNGHTMIAPYTHVSDFASLDRETAGEMMQLAQKVQAALEASYHPEGYNLGMNLGRCAGAGLADHLHLHILPRWMGDASFMTVIGETRVLPEALDETYDKLLRNFSA